VVTWIEENGFLLRPYQLTGVDFLASRSCAILGDDPGIGKSAQAIVAANQRKFSRVLIVCPAIGRVSWPKELALWDTTHRSVQFLTAAPMATPLPVQVCLIMSFDQTSRRDYRKLMRAIAANSWDLLIIDEGQYLKEVSSNRTKVVYGILAPAAANVWILSGTIAPNHNGELYTHLKALFPNDLSGLLGGRTDLVAFQDTFCKVNDTIYGRQIVGSKDTKRLRAAMGSFFLRRRKAEVLVDLPTLTIEHLEFEHDTLSQSQLAALNDALAALGGRTGGMELETWLEANAGHVASERRALGLAKAPLAAQWAEEQLFEGVPKLILFAHHKDVIAYLHDHLVEHNPVVLTGATSPASRLANVDRFQTDPECKIFIGQTHASGTAITLTAASVIGLAEPDWTPAINVQAIARAHRFGQHDGVIATFLSVKGTLDARINQIIRRKTKDTAELLD